MMTASATRIESEKSGVSTISKTRWPARRIVVIAVVVLAALAVRSVFFGYQSGDYRSYFGPWYDYIARSGGYPALKQTFSNYNVPYLYLVAALTYLPVPALVGLKLISVIFDLVLGYFAYRIVSLRYPGTWWPTVAAAVILFLPTVVLNSSWWAQVDAMYSSISVGGLYFLLRRRPWLACLFFGLAFSFKLQAVFLFPLLLLAVLRKHVPWRALLVIPVVYLALDVPALLLGANPHDLLLVYVTETNTYSQLTLGAPNVYQYFNIDTSNVIRIAGVVVTAALVLGLIIPIVVKRLELTRIRILLAGTVSVLLVPFFLPSMHDRYFYLADALTVLTAFYLPRRLWYLPIFEQFGSLFAYLPFLLMGNRRGGPRPNHGYGTLPTGARPSGVSGAGTPATPVPDTGGQMPGGGGERFRGGGGGFGVTSDALVNLKILSTAMLAALIVALWAAIKEFRTAQPEAADVTGDQ
jgi:Gpi18-like mannosyltransferase